MSGSPSKHAGKSWRQLSASRWWVRWMWSSPAALSCLVLVGQCWWGVCARYLPHAAAAAWIVFLCERQWEQEGLLGREVYHTLVVVWCPAACPGCCLHLAFRGKLQSGPNQNKSRKWPCMRWLPWCTQDYAGIWITGSISEKDKIVTLKIK